MNDQDKIAEQAEIARLTKTIAWYQGQAGQRIGEAARAGIAGAASAEQADDITCDQCIELEGELHREYARQAIAGTRTAASLLNEGAFRSGMETACDELETRLKLEPYPKSEVPTTRDDMWCALLAATDAYLNSDPDPAIMILRGDKQTWLALGTKAQIAMMCDGRSGAQMDRDAAAAAAAPLPELTGPSAEAAKLAPILRAMCEGGGEERHIDIYADSYQAGDGDVFVIRAATLLDEFAKSAASPPTPAQQQEPSAELPAECRSPIQITINGRQLRDALEAAWTERSDPDEGDTELTLFVRDKAEVSVEGEAMEPGLWFYWTDYPEEGVCYLDPNAPEPTISESVETAAPGASIGDAEPASTDCTYCYGLGEVQGQGSYADFEPPINKCSQCDGTGKA